MNSLAARRHRQSSQVGAADLRFYASVFEDRLGELQNQSDKSDVIHCWALEFSGERPMWKPEHRLAADRRGLRYPSDLTDAEWGIVAPMIPPGRHGGRRRSVNVREVLNGIWYVLWTGCQWKAVPKDLPPKSTVHDYLELWNWDGTLERIHHALYVAVRERGGT